MGYIRNKRTGEVVFVPDQQPSPQGVPIGPQDPAAPYRGQQAATGIQAQQAGIGKDYATTKRTTVQTAGDTLDNASKQRTLTQNPISEKDQALINSMRLNQGDMAGVLRDITGAQRAVDRFQPSPGRGSLYGAGTIQDGDFWSAPFKGLLGAVALPDKAQEDYQTLLGLQNQSVLNAQLAQKGPQTESDAIRMKLAGVSPNKDVRPNAQLLAEGQYDAQLKQGRPAFYEWWANKYGSTHALGKNGKTADEVWNEQYRRGSEQMRKDPRYTGVRGAPRKPQQSRVIDFNDWKD